MKYLCLVYTKSDAAPLSDAQEVVLKDTCITLDYANFQAGKVALSTPLEKPDKAVSIRYPNGVRTRTDGPFAETKEFIAGLMIVEADSFDEAVELVVAGPLDGLANFEIRPLLEQTHSTTGQDRSFLFAHLAG